MWNILAESENCHIPEAVCWHCDCYFCDEEREGRKWRDLEKNILQDVNGLMGMKLR